MSHDRKKGYHERFRKVENARVVKLGNNQNYKVKGYGKVTNEEFTIYRLA